MLRFPTRVLHLSTRMLLFALAFLVLPSPAMAQGETADLLQQLPGLEAAWARRYDNTEMYRRGPATPAANSVDIASTTVLEFDTETNASLSFAVGLTEETAALILGVDATTFDRVQDVPLGDQAQLFTARNGDRAAALLAIRDGNLGYLIVAHGTSDAIIGTVLEFGSFMVEAEPGAGEIVFATAGDTTDGLFDLFPARDDTDVLNGLLPMYDYDLLVSESPIQVPATPAA